VSPRSNLSTPNPSTYRPKPNQPNQPNQTKRSCENGLRAQLEATQLQLVTLYESLQAFLSFESTMRAPALAAVRTLKVSTDAASLVANSSAAVAVAMDKAGAAEVQVGVVFGCPSGASAENDLYVGMDVGGPFARSEIENLNQPKINHSLPFINLYRKTHTLIQPSKTKQIASLLRLVQKLPTPPPSTRLHTARASHAHATAIQDALSALDCMDEAAMKLAVDLAAYLPYATLRERALAALGHRGGGSSGGGVGLSGETPRSGAGRLGMVPTVPLAQLAPEREWCFGGAGWSVECSRFL